jgi:predicted hotdog family 3-hydroxylacyl-ACP dehydratase
MKATVLDHAGIAALIPHQGAMCLLERLEHCDEASIVCVASSHRDPTHALRTASGLLSTCAVEYAAQAMALHGALLGRDAGTPARPGYLASVRGVRLHRLRLDDLEGDLRIEARREAGNARQVLYGFAVTHAGAAIAEGRAAVVLDTPLALR